MAKRRKIPASERGWSIDKSGRWRDERGRFASRERVLDTFAMAGSPSEVSDMLRRSAKKLRRRGGKAKYIVMAEFAGVGPRTLGSSDDLRTVLEQGSKWLQVDFSQRLNDYFKHDKVAKRKLRRGESPEPRITDVWIRRIGPDSHERKLAKKRKSKRKGKKS